MRTPWVSFDGKDCSGCKHLNDRGYCEFTACIIPRSVRATIPEVKPQTNADRIRAMTDTELAWFYAEKIASCYGCESSTMEDCAKCCLDWLQQEAGKCD